MESETVTREAYNRIQADLVKQKAEAKAAREQAENLRRQGLKEKEDWKALATEWEAKAKESETKLNGMTSAIVNDKKMSAIKLEAKKAGILDSALEDLELIDFPEVGVETTSTGRMNVMGADRAVQRIKMSRPHWFSRSAPNINSNTPDVNPPGAKVTEAEIERLSAEARKTGDWSKVKTAMQQYKTQT